MPVKFTNCSEGNEFLDILDVLTITLQESVPLVEKTRVSWILSPADPVGSEHRRVSTFVKESLVMKQNCWAMVALVIVIAGLVYPTRRTIVGVVVLAVMVNVVAHKVVKPVATVNVINAPSVVITVCCMAVAVTADMACCIMELKLPRSGVEPSGPPMGTVAYPFYTTRGPRDFYAANPPSIGPEVKLAERTHSTHV